MSDPVALHEDAKVVVPASDGEKTATQQFTLLTTGGMVCEGDFCYLPEQGTESAVTER